MESLIASLHADLEAERGRSKARLADFFDSFAQETCGSSRHDLGDAYWGKEPYLRTAGTGIMCRMKTDRHREGFGRQPHRGWSCGASLTSPVKKASTTLPSCGTRTHPSPTTATR